MTALSVMAQVKPSPTPTPEENDVIRVDSNLVVVPVSVVDANGQPVAGLTAKDFILREENRVQEIAQVSDAEKAPLEIALLFDVSASIESMFDFQKSTAARFLQEVMREGDRATIIAVGNRPILVQSRADARTAVDAIMSVIPTKERTAFFDAVGAAAEYLRKNSSEGTRRIIVAISDGDDTNSAGVLRAIFEAEGALVKGGMSDEELRRLRYSARDQAKLNEQRKVVNSLLDADAVFYAINPLGATPALNASGQFGQSNLDRFAAETGGSSYIPKFESTLMKDPAQRSYNLKKNEDQISLIFRQLTNELRRQYLIQFYSDGDFPKGQYVNLKVELKGRTGMKVRARRGYFVQ